MNVKNEVKTLSINAVRASIYPSPEALGFDAAKEAADVINAAIKRDGKARIIVATGNSQLHLIDALTARTDVDWSAVEVFHMDEYVGISRDHPSSFRYWIKTRVEDRVHPSKMDYLEGDAPDLDAEIQRYSQLLTAGPIHLAFVGFGENGHIAFNDPPVADFNDPSVVKRVELDQACRKQQAGEGHFANPEAVPREAVTITCPGLFRSEVWVCSVPEARKAVAVKNALEGPISTACPASLVRRHPHASVYLDRDSAALLSVEAEVPQLG